LPNWLEEYFERLKRPGTGNAYNLSPYKNYTSIKERVDNLEKFLMDTSTLLLSNVSVRTSQVTVEQAERSIEEAAVANPQSRRATLITALAFVYVPLSFVTSFFGMNVGGGHWQWWWVLVALTIVTALTILLGLTVDFLERVWPWSEYRKRMQERVDPRTSRRWCDSIAVTASGCEDHYRMLLSSAKLERRCSMHCIVFVLPIFVFA